MDTLGAGIPERDRRDDNPLGGLPREGGRHVLADDHQQRIFEYTNGYVKVTYDDGFIVFAMGYYEPKYDITIAHCVAWYCDN